MLARLGGMLYRARWIAIFVVLVIVAGAAILGSGLFGVLKSGGGYDPASGAKQEANPPHTEMGGSASPNLNTHDKSTIQKTSTTVTLLHYPIPAPHQNRP